MATRTRSLGKNPLLLVGELLGMNVGKVGDKDRTAKHVSSSLS